MTLHRHFTNSPHRHILAACLCAAIFSFGAQAPPSIAWRTVGAGVEYAQFVRSTDQAGQPAGPWSVNVLRVDPSQVRLDVVHALDEAVGLETVSSIAERRGAIAAVNGGYFRTTGTFRGDAAGTLQIDGRLLSEPDRGRAALGFVRGGKSTRILMGHVTWQGSIEAAGQKRALDGINRPRGKDDIVLFTPGFHDTTLTDPTGTEVVVRNGRVTEIRDNQGSTPIPSDGYVVSAMGAAREWVRGRLRKGARVRLSVRLHPVDVSSDNAWTDAEDIVGGGPKLVTRGRVDITYEREKMLPTFSTDRHPRTAIGSAADGRVLLLAVDGRQTTSVGMSLDELARLLIELGAVEAVNLDGGGSTTMVVEGKVVNRPSDPAGERPVSDAIVITKGV